ncbi:hypothetical protein DYB26_007714 [Aphanomyces astaci]|nr:hypothetical protein DYB26_007714 [Aphanomyces astaci]
MPPTTSRARGEAAHKFRAAIAFCLDVVDETKHRINLLFSFTSVGVTEVPLTAGPPSFKIRGQMVHNLGSYRPKDALPPSFAQVYVLDSTNQDDVRSARASNMAFSNAQKQVIKFIQAFMLRHNHFCKT